MKKCIMVIFLMSILLIGTSISLSNNENFNPVLDFDDEDFPELVNLKG